MTTSASCSWPTTPACRSRPCSSRWTSWAPRSCRSCAASSRRCARRTCRQGRRSIRGSVAGAEPATRPTAAGRAGGDARMSASATRSLVVVTAGLSEPSSSRLLGDRLAAAVERHLREAGLEPRLEVIELRDHADGPRKPDADRLPHPVAPGGAGRRPRGGRGHRGHADLQRLVQRAVQAVLRCHRSRRLPRQADAHRRHRRARRATRWPSSTRCARSSPISAAAVVPTGVYAATEDWGQGAAATDGSLVERIERAATELAAAMTTVPFVAPRDEFADPVPFEDLLRH